MRRTIELAALLLAVCPAVSSCGDTAGNDRSSAAGYSSSKEPIDTAADRAPELILRNARIYTGDASMPWASAVAIRKGNLLAVGNDADVGRHADANTRLIDAKGRLVLPAFQDAHAHLISGGLQANQCALHDVRTSEAYVKLISACVRERPGSGWVYGSGWLPDAFPPDGVPHKRLLDAIAPDRPVAMAEAGGHALWVNSEALKRAGITRATPDPPLGRIDRDPATGEPIGGLQEAAMKLVESLIPPPTPEEARAALLESIHHFNSLGIVGWQDAYASVAPDDPHRVLATYESLLRQGVLEAHVAIALAWENDKGAEQLPDILAAAERVKAAGLRARTVKFFLDGVLMQRTAALLEPYSDAPDESGELQIPAEVFQRAAVELDARGFQVHVHALGDRAIHTALDGFASARARNGKTDNRHMISHANLISPENQQRFAKLDVTANFSPLWARLDPYMRLLADRVGSERMAYMYPAKSLLKAGARIVYGSDWPVTSADPLQGIEVALTRREPGKAQSEALLAHEGVTLEQAIEAYTINAAYVNHFEERTGSITVGKSADLVVLDLDLFTLPAREISKAKVLVTLFEGEAVHGDLAAL